MAEFISEVVTCTSLDITNMAGDAVTVEFTPATAEDAEDGVVTVTNTNTSEVLASITDSARMVAIEIL